jgi:hypothetical protein
VRKLATLDGALVIVPFVPCARQKSSAPDGSGADE